MTDYSELVKRLRSEIPYWRSHEQDTHLMTESATALEAQAKEIALLGRRISDCDDARDWLIERNRTLDARIAELETALKDLREAVCDIDDREMFLNERRRWESCLAKADEVLKGGSGD
jgi:hypothetical protein